MEFRTLRAEEIDVRIGTITGKGASLLLYKDARCDMAILDETVGSLNWKKHYELIDGQLFCTIEIWDAEKEQWVGKQDVGVESYTEAEKGRASDAQKRACVAAGIGRELYTSPRIFVKCPTRQKQTGRGYELVDAYQFYGCYVKKIEYDERRHIVELAICDNDNNVIFTYGDDAPKKSKTDLINEIKERAKEKGISTESICKKAQIKDLEDMDIQRLRNCIEWLGEQE